MVISSDPITNFPGDRSHQSLEDEAKLHLFHHLTVKPQIARESCRLPYKCLLTVFMPTHLGLRADIW